MKITILLIVSITVVTALSAQVLDIYTDPDCGFELKLLKESATGNTYSGELEINPPQSKTIAAVMQNLIKTYPGGGIDAEIVRNEVPLEVGLRTETNILLMTTYIEHCSAAARELKDLPSVHYWMGELSPRYRSVQGRHQEAHGKAIGRLIGLPPPTQPEQPTQPPAPSPLPDPKIVVDFAPDFVRIDYADATAGLLLYVWDKRNLEGRHTIALPCRFLNGVAIFSRADFRLPPNTPLAVQVVRKGKTLYAQVEE